MVRNALMLWFALLFSSQLLADDRFANVTISTQAVGDGVYMISGAGGNIGVSAGPDGLLMVDDQYAPLADRISAALKELSPHPPKYVINTHMHGDHTGSNSEFAKHATIFAHDHVLRRLTEENTIPREGLPVVTYSNGITFHFNQQTIEVAHFPSGHTDGDSVVWFKQAKVLHMGDLFFNGKFPFIDLKRGGSVMGYLQNVELLYRQIKSDTKIIPGHGPLADRAALGRYLEMLETHINWIKQAKAEGQSLLQLQQQGVAEEWKTWSWPFIDEQRWIATLYEGL